MSIFDELTNKYSLSKTLRFELKPFPETKEAIKNSGILESAKVINTKYVQIKPILDRLHERFITDSLTSSNINWDSYSDIYTEFTTNKTGDVRIKKEKIEESFRKNVVALFDIQGEVYKKEYNKKWKATYPTTKEILKEKGIKILTESGIIKALQLDYEDDTSVNDLLTSFDRFFSFFSGYNQNRENYYSDKAKDTSVANRIVNENLPIFYLNKTKVSNYPKDKFPLLEDFKNLNYNQHLTQEGIEKYNELIGRLNSKINEYNQGKNTKEKLKLLKTLRKQIGCKRIKIIQTLLEEIKDKQELEKFLTQWVAVSDKYIPQIVDLIDKALDGNFGYEEIYFSKNALTGTVFPKLFLGGYDGAMNFLENTTLLKVNKTLGELQVNKDFTPLTDFRDIFSKLEFVPKDVFKSESWSEDILSNSPNSAIVFNLIKAYNENLFGRYKEFAKKLNDLLSTTDFSNDWDTNQRKQNKNIIKDFGDSALDIYRMLKIFQINPSKVKSIGADFYNDMDSITEIYRCPKQYDLVRNFLTKSVCRTDKLRIIFDQPNLLGGWADSPEGNTQFYGFLFKDDSQTHTKYLLGISKDSKIYDKNKHPEAYGSGIKKMVYKQLDGKTIYGSLYKGMYKNAYAQDLAELKEEEVIARVKALLKKKVAPYFPEVNNILNKVYVTPKDLARDIVEATFYSLNFVEVSTAYFNKISKVQDSNSKSQMFVFEITNKDMGKVKETGGVNNLHTDYFLSAFNNINSNIKISGGGAIFFREKTPNLPLKARVSRDNKDKWINTDELTESEKLEDLKTVVSGKRYQEDKYLFHLPIVLNHTKSNRTSSRVFNHTLNSTIQKNIDKTKIIGIDRGEKNLAYYCIISTKGEIEKCGDLNLGYKELLEQVAKNRQSQRKNWDEITKIKNLKEGYISIITKEVANLALKNNAFVVLEDLNTGFKQSRQKIESSVYQNMELALAKKLGYLVIKQTQAQNPGSVSNAYQLVPPTNTFGDIKGKQWGAMLYTSAAYTSKICPSCGFRKKLRTNFESIEKTKDFIKSSINVINRSRDIFTFGLIDENKVWTIKTNVKRVRWYKSNQLVKLGLEDSAESIYAKTQTGFYKEYLLTECFTKLFNGKINTNNDIKAQLLTGSFDQSFYKSLMFYFDLLFQIRNSTAVAKDNKDIVGVDYISCPVCGFDSTNNKMSLDLITNGDANGAYNIARKGLIMLSRLIKDPQKPDLYIKNEDWDKVAQNWTGFCQDLQKLNG